MDTSRSTPPLPRFERGERVLYRSLGKMGVIEKIINLDDPADIQAQGHRYYVRCAGWIWSASENALAKARKSPTKSAPQKLEMPQDTSKGATRGVGPQGGSGQA